MFSLGQGVRCATSQEVTVQPHGQHPHLPLINLAEPGTQSGSRGKAALVAPPLNPSTLLRGRATLLWEGPGAHKGRYLTPAPTHHAHLMVDSACFALQFTLRMHARAGCVACTPRARGAPALFVHAKH
jgi:hypothetical protein